jgi:hydrogenase nickel incorporation protein HypA/HybF
MHELSVALRIVEALDQEMATEPEDLVVSTVAIQVGTLTGLVPEALLFSWAFATDGSTLKGSKLDIHVVDAAGYCPQCREEQTLTNLQSMRCPVCRTPIAQITGGNELEILTVEVQPADDGSVDHGFSKNGQSNAS